MKVYVVGNNPSCGTWFGSEIVDQVLKADVCVFTGGADVYPDLYDEPIHSRTHYNEGRDAREMTLFEQCKRWEIPMLGICRGSQFLTVMNGGRLIQDVTNHASFGGHNMYLKPYDTEINITSTHHQMMYPFDLPPANYELLGWTKEPLSDHYQNGLEEEMELPDGFVEPEVVYYPMSNSLGIQGHPEFMHQHSDAVTLLRSIINDYLA